MKKRSPHPDAAMLTDAIDHEAATKKCQQYIEDFPKIVQHSKADVNLARAYLALVEEAKKLSARVIELEKVNVADIPETENNPKLGNGIKEGIDIKCDFSCASGSDEGRPTFRFTDANSGCMIMDVSLDYKSFGQLMTNLGHRPAKARIFNTFNTIGLYSEGKLVMVTRPKSWDTDERDREVKEIIKRECADIIKEGWLLHSDGTSSQQNGDKWKVHFIRFVKTKPASRVETD